MTHSFRFFGIAVISILKYAGESTLVLYCCASIYGHNTVVANGVPAVSIIAIGVTGTFFFATGIGTTVDGNSTIVIHCGSTMRNVIHSTRSLNRQGTAQSYRNSVLVRFVGQGITIQVQGNSFVFRNSDALRYIFSKSDRRLSCINSALQGGSLRHRHDGQHYSHHKQGQRYAYYFFHINRSFLFFVFCPQEGSCLHTNTKTPHGASDTLILAPFCPQYQYHCAFFCINFPLIFVHYSIFGTHPAKKTPPKAAAFGGFS